MNRIIYTLLLIGFCFNNVQAQLNDYKYVIVPKKFDAFKKENQYLTSTLVKHLFTEKGFDTVYDDALPLELNNNRCLALTAQVDNASSMFSTKAAIVLLDCQSREVFRTEQGTSKEKEYKLSYNEAIRNAFKSFDGISYAYTPGTEQTKEQPITVSMRDDVKTVPEKPETVPEIKEVVKAQEAADAKAKMTEQPAEKLIEKTVVAPEEATQKKEIVSTKVVEPVVKKKEVSEAVTADSSQIWYAQQIANGYQLVDSTPKVRLKIYTTSRENVFLSENDKGNGLVYKKDGKWLLEYYDGAVLKKEEIKIKF